MEPHIFRWLFTLSCLLGLVTIHTPQNSRILDQETSNDLTVNSIALDAYQAAGNPECGIWVWSGPNTPSDLRIKTSPINYIFTLPECRGAFLLQNTTAFEILSGYTLELNVQTHEASYILQPDLDPNKAFFNSMLDLEIHSWPQSISQPGTVFIQGNLSDRTVAVDMTIRLIKAALDFGLPGSSCVIQPQAIASISVEVYEIVLTSASLAFSGRIIASMEEFNHVRTRFFNRVQEAFDSMKLDCGAEIISELLKKPAALFKIGVDVISWFGKSMFDLWKFNGLPASVYLDYKPSIIPPSPTIALMPTTIANEISGFVGVWHGPITGGTEYNSQAVTEEKVFEIQSNCYDGQDCLNVWQALDFHYKSLLPYPKERGTDECFALIKPASSHNEAYPFYLACFTLQPDGTLKYGGSGPLWGENGVLERMDDQSFEALKVSVNASCQQTLEPRMKNGMQARVAFTDGYPLVLRAYPGTNSQKVGSIPEGDQISILSGPVCSDGYWWWFVSSNGSLVWVAEGDSKVYFIEPIQ